MQYIVICYILFFEIKLLVEKTNLNESVMLIVIFMLWFAIESYLFANPDMPFLKARQMLSFPFGVFVAKYKERTEKFFNGRKLILISGGYNGNCLYGNNTAFNG